MENRQILSTRHCQNPKPRFRVLRTTYLSLLWSIWFFITYISKYFYTFFIFRILTSNKIDVSKSYLKSGEEHYSFISLPALWTILDVEDPLVVLLEGKNAFQKDLMELIYKSIARNFKGHEKFTILGGIPWMMLDEKLHFHKAKTVALSGLYDKANKLQAFHSNYVSLEDVLKLIRLDR